MMVGGAPCLSRVRNKNAWDILGNAAEKSLRNIPARSLHLAHRSNENSKSSKLRSNLRPGTKPRWRGKHHLGIEVRSRRFNMVAWTLCPLFSKQR
eukprot:4141445-Amphidinium_carterae.1